MRKSAIFGVLTLITSTDRTGPFTYKLIIFHTPPHVETFWNFQISFWSPKKPWNRPKTIHIWFPLLTRPPKNMFFCPKRDHICQIGQIFWSNRGEHGRRKARKVSNQFSSSQLKTKIRNIIFSPFLLNYIKAFFMEKLCPWRKYPIFLSAEKSHGFKC